MISPMTTTSANFFPSLITAKKDYRRAAAETEALARCLRAAAETEALARCDSKSYQAALNRECAAWRNYVNAGGSFSPFTKPY